jgi:hypothetical protein
VEGIMGLGMKENIDEMNSTLPFTLKGVESDNGGEFINIGLPK